MTIASEITRLQWAKSCIKASIEWKGVTVGSSLKLDSYYSCINAIPAAVYLTQAEYDDLPSSKLTDWIPYGIMSNWKVSKFIRNWTEFNPSSFLDYIIVWGWWAWWWAPRNAQTTWWWGWGWWWEVKLWTLKVWVWDSYSVSIWSWWARGTSVPWCPWCTTTFWSVVANGWCWWEWWQWIWCKWWMSWSWCQGSCWRYFWWGWGWAWWDWIEPTWALYIWWCWWPWICWYWWGWGWGNGWGWWTWCDWWWNGSMSWSSEATDATNYWWWWGWWSNNYRSQYAYGWAWCQWIVIVCYKTDWSCWFSCATWWTVTTSWDYTVHTFTTDWTFTIVS